MIEGLKDCWSYLLHAHTFNAIGYGFGQPVQHVPIKVVNLDEGGKGVPLLNINDTYFSDIGIQFLEQDERVDITLIPSSTFNLTEEKTKIYGGKGYYALIVFLQ